MLWGDVTFTQIGVPPFVTSRHLLVFPPPSLSGVTSFMDGPLEKNDFWDKLKNRIHKFELLKFLCTNLDQFFRDGQKTLNILPQKFKFHR